MRVRLLGPVDVLVDGNPQAVPGLRRTAVLAALALEPGAVVSSDRLIDVVWGDGAPATAAATLQSHVSRLRRVLGDKPAIGARPPGYVLDVGDEATDVQAAERLIRQAGESSEPGRRLERLRAAVALWRGRPLADLAGLGWFDDQARRLEQLLAQARHALIDARLALGQHLQLIPELESLCRQQPLHEQTHGQLILALYRAGRQGDALAAYHRLRRTLDEELGVNPSQPLRDLETAILRQDPTLDPSPAANGPVPAAVLAASAAHDDGLAGHEDGLADRLADAGVTEREAEVLLRVAERLRNREIADRLHLSVRTVESHVAALRRKLGVSDRSGLAELGMQLRRSARPGAALATPLTTLIGRDRETSELMALLDAHRLVTLTGPGGVGKTRLALHVATAGGDAFPDGARLADLAAVDRDLVGDTIARALGVIPRPGFPLADVLREATGGMECLLLVDNCEHVIAEAAGLVAELLTAGGRLRVLATSREPLGIPGEVSYQVQTLPVPAPPAAPAAATAGTYDAVRLFVERAAAASPGFTLTDAVAPAVAALCRRLDGLPLAIELAASRVRSFEPAELVAHLDQRFELLSGGARTVLERHRTLRGAIDWSYRLLDDDERTLFDRLGVFPAEFDYQAVQSVAGDDDAGAGSVMALLPRLVDKSLVSSIGRGTRRYRLLETIRAYAAERLAASAAGPGAKRRHAAHYLRVAEQAHEQLRGRDQRAWLDRLTAEQPNLRAAMAHSISAGDLESAWRWINALERFWDITGQRREAYEWVRRTLAIGDPPATPAVVSGLAAASMLLRPSDAKAGFGLAQRAERLAAGLDDLSRAKAGRAVGINAIWIQPELVQPALHDALCRFGQEQPWERALTLQGLATTSGGLADVLRWARESVALFRRVGDQMAAANTLFIMAQRSIYAGIADDEVQRWLTASQALAEASGSEDDRVHATVGFAQLAWHRGDRERAAELMEHCLPALRRLGDERCIGRALHILGERAHDHGQLARAEELLSQSVEAVARAGQVVVLVNSLEAMAGVVSARGRPRLAALLLGTAHAARESASAHMRPIQPPDDQLRRQLIHALGAAAFEDAHRHGERLSPTQALRLRVG